MKEVLYMDDSYLEEFDATVTSIKDGIYVVLDRTSFYPGGGGQPYDTGKMRTGDRTEYSVVFAGRFSGQISHEVDKPGLKEGDRVHCVIDWERRYRHMRAHTASHIISAVFEKRTGAKITGNQLGADKSRIDYNLDEFDKEKIAGYIEEANEIARKDIPVRISYMKREDALKHPSLVKLANVLPPNVDTLRIVDIEGVDKQADGGTHVKSTSEIGAIVFLKAENKGKNNRRVYFRLANS